MREICSCGTEMRTLKLLKGGLAVSKCPHCDNGCIVANCPNCLNRNRAAK